VDSPSVARFDAADAKGIEALRQVFMELAWEPPTPA
jgi:GAF domain-containing protein